jgi:hypothetical protein
MIPGLGYFAVVYPRRPKKQSFGYVLDVYPIEEKRYRKELQRSGARVLGPYLSREAANNAIVAAMIKHIRSMECPADQLSRAVAMGVAGHRR